MAKRKLINGRKYSFFIDHDRGRLRKYQEDYVDWLEQRVYFILIDPIIEIFKRSNKKKFDNENFTLFLGITTIICCGIETLGGFYNGRLNKRTSRKDFKDFVKKYMGTIYSMNSENLDALYNHFRCGLAHGFCIKQGGITWKGPYFSKHKKLGLLINIRELFRDFRQAFLKYMRDLKKADTESTIMRNFEKQFEYIFILGN